MGVYSAIAIYGKRATLGFILTVAYISTVKPILNNDSIENTPIFEIVFQHIPQAIANPIVCAIFNKSLFVVNYSQIERHLFLSLRPKKDVIVEAYIQHRFMGRISRQ
ncbi:hypothetical protein AB0759_20975 [Scytonema tolypothrichoides VB-61278_2]|uniref:Uncharacterized protein n=1 Tax=Scytonema tolypothrichoides VB-61278_2 TaxID=3232314 RepID=A0ABW8WQ45_9CYAN